MISSIIAHRIASHHGDRDLAAGAALPHKGLKMTEARRVIVPFACPNLPIIQSRAGLPTGRLAIDSRISIATFYRTVRCLKELYSGPHILAMVASRYGNAEAHQRP